MDNGGRDRDRGGRRDGDRNRDRGGRRSDRTYRDRRDDKFKLTIPPSGQQKITSTYIK